MESSYGIGVTNRYDLFCMDDDAHDPGDSVLNRKAKQKKAAAKAAAAAAAAAGGAEKENKAIIAPATIGKEKDQAPKVASAKTNAAGGGGQTQQQPAKARAIKETQNIRNNSDRAPREG